ncbi:uncharacterized protein THITE_2106517 [Thermothielavioides terrestris NRRL 8126]|uniref:Acyltransferase 3 domain-containing protein n=1 Tax=Thermothielavioides terrestris (strain ATCC 38088 / NRRL 8126) TaxID=578455 RepID=G2QQJ1_THETT|nr:uncharacterized protein THITE_2106517 [Thermothielavioides terrestris NRRL 8126]AEO62401.1 hypothetical protein THITE_2106517 [Thermothielavioides terrestris NRRL 8126]
MNSHGAANYEEKTSFLDGISAAHLQQRWPPPVHPHQLLAHLSALLLRAVLFLVPSFLQPHVQRRLRPRLLTTTASNPPNPGSSTSTNPSTSTSPARLSPTAYLDGMRGFAAAAVFLCHYFYTAFKIAPGFGSGGGHWDLPKLPFVRLVFSGPPMVCVFFVVSGYALSARPAALAHARDWAGLLRAVGSLTFRRAIRLFVPTAASTLLVVVLVRLGAYEWTREFASDDRFVRNYKEHHYHRLETTREQLREWAKALFNFVHVWDWQPFGGSMAMDVHLWTIPVEFRCSMVLFLTMVGTARLRRPVRMAVVAGLVLFVYWSERWEMVLFYAGMVLAELDVVRGAHGSGLAGAGALPVAASPAPGRLVRRFTTKRTVWMAVSIVGLYLMSQPDEDGGQAPGWVYLTSLIPKWWKDEHRYWQSVGAILFVLAVGRSAWWQRFFTLPAVQYFGKISYAIYLMHGPVLHTVGYAIERWAWGLTGVEGRAYAGGFFLASLFVVPVVIWAADVFWRAVDVPVVKFAKWLEAKCSLPE